MRKLFVFLGMIWCVFIINSSFAADPDFFIEFSSCKIAVGYLVLSEESLKIFDGDVTVMACNRRSDNISCDITFKGQSKKINVQYQVTLDSPPLLHFSTKSGSEYIAIDTSQHAAVLINRVLETKFAGSKVCHGLYTTAFEMKNLKNK
jgi:hypothetical protein